MNASIIVLCILVLAALGFVRHVRGDRHGLAGLVNSSPAPTAAILTGKVLANGALVKRPFFTLSLEKFM